MKTKKDINQIYEEKIITRCILKGMTLKQIAKELKCAKSSASYKTRKLFDEYKVNDRYEFTVNIFSKIILNYKNKIANLENEMERYKNL